LILLSVLGNAAAAESSWFVLIHTPGSKWNSEVSYTNQQGVQQHNSYMAQRLEEGTLVLGGHFQDSSGAMMILKVGSIEQATEIARNDPAVKSGLLNVEVKSWHTPLSSMNIRKRKAAVSIPKNSAFKVKSESPGAPINIENE
jgi:uncharacterized protein YciI